MICNNWVGGDGLMMMFATIAEAAAEESVEATAEE
jgi:hypothetical protein